jgi:hypothetical protein
VHRRTAEKVDALVAELAGGAEGLLAGVAEQIGRIDAVIDCTAADMALSWLKRLGHAAHPHLAREGATLIAFISDARIFAAPRQPVAGAHDGGRMRWHPRAHLAQAQTRRKSRNHEARGGASVRQERDICRSTTSTFAPSLTSRTRWMLRGRASPLSA